jgi:tetratricopeptide (TPR) repeat protein
VSAAASALLQSATAALRRGDVRVASADGDRAAEGFWKQGDADGRMRALNLLGAVAFETGSLDRARERFEAALGLARGLDDVLLTARASNNLASVANLRGDSLEALSLYRAALLGYQRLGDRRGAGETCHNLALVFREIGALDDAEDACEQALRHAEVAGDRQLLALAVLGRAELDVDRANHDLAQKGIERGRVLMREAGDEVGVLEAERLDALIALRQGRVRDAAATAESGADRAQVLGARLLEAELAALASLALWRLSDDSAATRRGQALAGFRELGASGLIVRYEGEWSAVS